MVVEPWEGGNVRRVGSHPKIFVAKGSHNACQCVILLVMAIGFIRTG
jgi:hypothetical protein